MGSSEGERSSFRPLSGYTSSKINKENDLRERNELFCVILSALPVVAVAIDLEGGVILQGGRVKVEAPVLHHRIAHARPCRERRSLTRREQHDR
jgi:hypothetical protein